MELGKLDDAAKKFQRAIDLDPKNANALNNLSVVFIRQGKLNDVITTVKKGLKLKPDEAALYYNWGIALSQQDHHKEALEKMEAGFEIHDHDLSEDPSLRQDYVGMHQWWVWSLLKVGRYSDAIDRCKWALELNPEDERLNVYMGVALQKVGKVEEAVKDLEKAIELGASDEAVRTALSEAKEAQILPKDTSQ